MSSVILVSARTFLCYENFLQFLYNARLREVTVEKANKSVISL